MNESTVDHRYLTAKNIVYYVLGIIETLLAFRLIFKLLGANAASGFVSFIYALTKIMVMPFQGIFNSVTAKDAVNQYVFEPAIILAMIIYAIIAYGIIRMMKIKQT